MVDLMIRGATAHAALSMCAVGVLMVSMRGLLTRAILAEFMRDIERRVPASVEGFVFDSRAAALGLGLHSLAELRKSVGRDSVLHRPAALLTSVGNADLIHAYTVDLAKAGFLRRAFLHEGDAVAWVMQQINRQRAAAA